MKEYLMNKLKNVIKEIERKKEDIVKAAYNLDIKLIQDYCARLTQLQDRYKELSKDAGINLTVNEYIELFNAKLVDEYSISYAFKYDRKPITLTERDALVRISYQFKEAKV